MHSRYTHEHIYSSLITLSIRATPNDCRTGGPIPEKVANIMLYTSGEIECLPQEVGYDASRIEVLHSYFQKLINEKMIQGASYSVARYGKTFMQGALGPISYRDSTTPMLPTSVYRIASITKVFTTIAIAKLVEDGRIRFDDPVGSILK